MKTSGASARKKTSKVVSSRNISRCGQDAMTLHYIRKNDRFIVPRNLSSSYEMVPLILAKNNNRTEINHLIIDTKKMKDISISKKHFLINIPCGNVAPRKVVVKKSVKISDHPAVGMWADRDDMADPVAYVEKIRNSGKQ